MSNEIVKWDDPVLKRKCEEISVKEFQKLKQKMVRALQSEPSGVGLAAPQIGISKRMILVKKSHHHSPVVMANPVMVSHGEHIDTDWEGCLSFPDHNVRVKRWTSVDVTYMNKKGNRIKATLDGYEARVFQHELDHLDGICRVGDAWRDGTSVSNQEMLRLREEAARAPLGAAATTLATGMGLPYKSPPMRPGKCTRTACSRDGEGFYHREMIKGDLTKSNYCHVCAKLINDANGQELILPGPGPVPVS